MVSEETLGMVKEAFYNVRRTRGLCGWDLGDKVLPPFLHESNSDSLTVSLVRGDTELTSFSLHIRSLVRPDGGVTAERLEGEIEAALREKGFLRGSTSCGRPARRAAARTPRRSSARACRARA